jgi:PAS domain S-box-containing protein
MKLLLENVQDVFAADELEQIFEAMADGVWVCDSTPKLLWINSACETLNNIRREDVCGKSVEELLSLGNIDTDVTQRVLREKKPVTIIQKVKSKRTLLVNGVPIFDKQGNVKFVVGSERDMTELNLLKEEIEQKTEVTKKIQSELLSMKMRDLQLQEIVACSDAMERVMEMVLRVADFDTTVLLTGASGTGKSLVARLIHDGSNRRGNPFLTLNCGAIPDALAEAELFGYADGAFTGAQQGGKCGLIETADGGTLFLDEIDAFSPDVQVKLLTFLDTQSFIKVGGRRVQQVDVRLIAATNSNLESKVEQGLFRGDLWYRLNVVPIELPPLSERVDDIFPLVAFFLKRLADRHKLVKSVDRFAMEFLSRYHYPGNVRELENILEHSYVLSRTDEITLSDLPQKILDAVSPVRTPDSVTGPATTNLKQALNAVEREQLSIACRKFKTQKQIADALGTSQPSIARLLKKHDFRIEAG